MSRASDGTYSLPAGNPVSTLTTISITWANNTLSDLSTAMTDSLSRSGSGGMLAALELDAGAVGLPALTFTLEPTLGLYRSAAATLSAAVGGVNVGGFNSSGIHTAVGLQVTAGTTAVQALTATTMVASSTISFPVGLVGTPGLFFTGDANTGIWQATADTLSFTGGGTNLMTLSATQLATATTMKIVSGAGGTAALPAYTFFGDTNTGMSAETADTLVLSTAGTARLTITTVLTSGVAFRGADGSANTPMYSFTDDTNTGIYAESGYCKVTHNGTGWAVGYLELPINTINGSETLTLPDSGKCIHKASGGAGETISIPANATVAYPTGTAITFVNTGGGDLSIAILSDTMTMAGTGDTGTRTLASPGVATAIKLTSTTWLISGTGLS